MSFANLKPVPKSLYRGWSGQDKETLVTTIGVGPARDVADALRKWKGHPSSDLESAISWLFNALLKTFNTPASSIPMGSPLVRLDNLLKLPKVGTNHFTIYEHIDDRNQIGTFGTGRAVESTSKDPQISLLYAYGLRIDPWLDRAHAEFYGSKPNDDAFVAVVSWNRDDQPTPVPDEDIEGVNISEVKRRAARDSEVLLTGVHQARIVQLPTFDLSNPQASLDRAAAKLRLQKVAL